MQFLLYTVVFLTGISFSIQQNSSKEVRKEEDPQQYNVSLCSHSCNGRGYCSRNLNGSFVCKCFGKYFGPGCEHPQMPVHLAQLYSRKNHSININSAGYSERRARLAAYTLWMSVIN